MEFDKINCIKDSIGIRADVVEIQGYLGKIISHYLGMDLNDATCNSPKQISALLFGGQVSKKIRVSSLVDGKEVRFKTGVRKGEVKTKFEERKEEVAGLGFVQDSDWATKKDGVFQVNDDVIEALLKKQPLSPSVTEMLKKLQKFRSLNKDLKTYYVGYSDLVWPDGRIHPSLNHCATATGRLSHSQPNIGNVAHAKDD